MKETAEPNPELDAARKRQMVHITAQSFFDEMMEYGFNEADVIDFTTEILDLLITKDKRSRHHPDAGVRSYPAEYRTDSGGKVVEIAGPRLCLNPLLPADRSLLERWREGDSYRGTLIERIFEPGVPAILRHFSSEHKEFFIVRTNVGAPLGFLTYQLDWTDPSRAEMQKFLADREQRGRGFGSEMTYLWLHYGFTKLNLRKVSAKTVDSNLVNINLNRKLGFRFEGSLREEIPLRDSFVDVTVMSVLRDDVRPLFRLDEDPESASQPKKTEDDDV